MPDQRDVKERVRDQFAATAARYVRSAGHASGNDLQRMLELAAPVTGDRLLDIATGGGHVAKVFGPVVGSITIADLTREMLVAARSFLWSAGLDRLEVVAADAESLPFRDGSFDIVTCRIAPHHFPNPGHFVMESARVLKSGGRFLLVDSTVADGEAGDRFNRFEKIRDDSHVRSLTVGEWASLIEQAGLRLGSVELFRKRHDFADWTARSGASEEKRHALTKLMRSAPSNFVETYQVTWNGDQIDGFSDEKTLFLASKS